MFSPDGEHLASAEKNGTVRIWSVRTGLSVFEYELGIDIIEGGVGFSNDCSLLVTISLSRDDSVRIWDIKNRALISHLSLGHVTYPPTFAFDMDSRRLFIGSSDGTVKVLDTSASSSIHVSTLDGQKVNLLNTSINDCGHK